MMIVYTFGERALVQTRTGKVLHAGYIEGPLEDSLYLSTYFTACGLSEWAYALDNHRWTVISEGQVTCKRCLKAANKDVEIDSSNDGCFVRESIVLVQKGGCFAVTTSALVDVRDEG